MGQPDALVVELISVDRFAASSIPGSDVATLHHEVLDNPVEVAALVVHAFLSCTQAAKVLRSLRHVRREELKEHPAFLCLLSLISFNLDVEEDLGVGRVESWEFFSTLFLFLSCRWGLFGGHSLLRVESLGEDGLRELLLVVGLLLLEVTDPVVLLTHGLVVGAQLDLFLDVEQRLIVLLGLCEGLRLEEVCLR